jgi:hypothetical protein
VESILPAAIQGELPGKRDLLLQALLHLPRMAQPDGTIEVGLAVAEIERLREMRAKELTPLLAIALPPALLPSLDQLEVRVIDPGDAEPIVSHFHYLRSFREDSVNVAALYRHRIVALCSVSPLDLPHISDKLPIISAEEAAVISRVFAFDWAPRSVVSYMLARAEKVLALRSEIRILLTYLNPNMGFTGASYRAANWRQVGLEAGTRYAYLRGEYITDRRLLSLTQTEGRAVEFSHMPLLPLIVLARFLDPQLNRVSTRFAEFIVEHPARSDALAR